MPKRDEIRAELGQTIERLEAQLDTAVDRSVHLREAGADENVVLAETALAVGAARALERLTGVSWDERLEAKGDASLSPDES